MLVKNIVLNAGYNRKHCFLFSHLFSEWGKGTLRGGKNILKPDYPYIVQYK
jgi:hypothetical protein